MEAYDPLNYANLAESIVRALEAEPLKPLPPSGRFMGAGVYALYYCGPLACYAPLVQCEEQLPIYVGSAIAGGGRKGEEPGFAPSQGYELYQRLRNHADSLRAADDLDIGDFQCRYLVVLPAWILLAERVLITKYQPVWNKACDGFGMHDPGAKRRTGKKPRWDTLHPGRRWASDMPEGESRESILDDIRRLLS